MFGELIVCYLFLAGVGAGSCAVLSIMGLFVPSEYLTCKKERELFFPAFTCSLLVMLLSVVCLLGDIGRIDRLMLLITSPTLSHIAIGAYALVGCVALSFMLSLYWSGLWRSCPVSTVRVLCVVLVIASFVVMLYAGLLLSGMRAVPLWNTASLPALFVVSAFSCGMASVMALAHLRGWAKSFSLVMRRLMMGDVALKLIELAVFAAYMFVCAGMLTDAGNTTEMIASVSAERLLRGDLAPWLWGGFGLCGVVVPLIAEVVLLRSRRQGSPLCLAVAALVLVGAFAMRYCVVQAGMHPPMF